ncbi:hypothetical protein WME90_01560 [Sorangium sp. So ce375]|uniref:hypothetical protein n=1 Tax=Sorangium sp. So ce375 TaxID=3133306 RepID=UPI003F5C83C7
MILPPKDADVIDPPNPNVTASPIPPRPGVELTISDPCHDVASIEPPDPHAHALGLALAIAVVALRR